MGATFWDRFFQGALQGLGELQETKAGGRWRVRGEFKEVSLSNISVKWQVNSRICVSFAPNRSKTDRMARAGARAAPQPAPRSLNEEDSKV